MCTLCTHWLPGYAMEFVKFRDLRENLSGYLRQAHQGQEFIVTSRGEEVARLGPLKPTQQQRRQPGRLAGQVWMAEDFDETPEDLIRAMEGDGE